MVDIELLHYLETYLTENRKQRFENVLSQRTKYITVAIEDVYQLHNTSAVIRSCDVFGVQELHVIEEINAKRIDSEIAMGAQKWVDVKRHDSVKACIHDIKSQGYQIVATTPHDNESLLQDFKMDKPSCFFFGRETEGLSDAVMENADTFLKIPMSGFTESLNISVSAAIILQHMTTQLRQGHFPWKLSDEEINVKKMDWIKKTIKSYDEIVARYYSK